MKLRAQLLFVWSVSSVVGSKTYAPDSVLPQYEGFIRVHERKFVDANCRQFPVTGVNT